MNQEWPHSDPSHVGGRRTWRCRDVRLSTFYLTPTVGETSVLRTLRGGRPRKCWNPFSEGKTPDVKEVTSYSSNLPFSDEGF